MIEVNKQWSTWIAGVAGAAGVIMTLLPQLSLPEPWPNVILIVSSLAIYIAKNIKQKPKAIERCDRD